MRDEWETHRSYVALANREATKFEATRRLLVGFLNQLAAEGDTNVDELVDSSVLAVASTHFPPVLREERAEVPSVDTFLQAPTDLSQPNPVMPSDFFGLGNAFDLLSAEKFMKANPNEFDYYEWPEKRGGQPTLLPPDSQKAETSRQGAQQGQEGPNKTPEVPGDHEKPMKRQGSVHLEFGQKEGSRGGSPIREDQATLPPAT